MLRVMRPKATVVLGLVPLALAVTTFGIAAEPDLDIDSASVVTEILDIMTGINSSID